MEDELSIYITWMLLGEKEGQERGMSAIAKLIDDRDKTIDGLLEQLETDLEWAQCHPDRNGSHMGDCIGAIQPCLKCCAERHISDIKEAIARAGR